VFTTTPVPVLVMAMFACVITAPELSVTVPLIVPVVISCALPADREIHSKQLRRGKAMAARVSGDPIFLKHAGLASSLRLMIPPTG
jgi:hypothetical protein